MPSPAPQFGILGTTPTTAVWSAAAAGLPGLRITGVWPDATAALTDLRRAATAGATPAGLLFLDLPGGAAALLIPELRGLARGVMLQPDAARDGRDADRLRRLAKKAGLAAFVANTLCFAPAFARVAELVTAGILGSPLRATLTLRGETPAAPRPLRLNGGALLHSLGNIPECLLQWQTRTDHGDSDAELLVQGDAGTVTARLAGAAGLPEPVHYTTPAGYHRQFPVPPGQPTLLCLAAALTCLRRGETLSFLDLKPWADRLAAGGA